MKVISIILLIIVFSACKKYDQGPTISFNSKESRIMNNWKAEIVYNPNNILQTFDYKGRIQFKEDYTFYEIIDEDTLEGTWNLSPDKLYINVIDPVLIPYKILKLKKKELWILDEISNKEYHLIPGS